MIASLICSLFHHQTEEITLLRTSSHPSENWIVCRLCGRLLQMTGVSEEVPDPKATAVEAPAPPMITVCLECPYCLTPVTRISIDPPVTEHVCPCGCLIKIYSNAEKDVHLDIYYRRMGWLEKPTLVPVAPYREQRYRNMKAESESND